MKGRGAGFKRLNLGRSIDEFSEGLQHLRVGSGVVSLGIGLVVPQTDYDRMLAAGI